MKRLILFAAFLFSTLLIHAQAPTFQWAKSMGGYYGYSTGMSVVVDASGNVYTTGYFEGRIDFDPGAGVFLLSAAGLNDVFITKTNASGNFVWAKQFGGISNDRGYSIALSGSGNIYIAGIFSDVADFDPGVTFNNLTSAGGTDIFISMLDASGNVTWVRQIGGAMDDVATAIAIDATNNVYTTGGFIGNVDFDPGAGNFNLNTGGSSSDVFISKLNSGGNFVWAKQMEGNSSFGNSITIDPSGNVYTAGGFSNTVDFDPGGGVFNLTASLGPDVFISKLNQSGNFIWAKHLAGSYNTEVNSIKTDAAGNVYTTGSFMDTVDFDPGPAVYNLTSTGYGDIYISKLSGAGNYIWVKQFGGATNNEDATSIFLDGSGNIYTIGDFHGTFDFDPGPGIFNLTSSATSVFVHKINSSGNFEWAKEIESTDNVFGTSVTGDAAGNIYIAGNFKDVCDFDPGAGTFNLTALGGNFMFISKLDVTGGFLWTKSAGVGASTIAKSMTTDLAGNVYTTGDFYGTVDFDPGPGIYNLSSAAADLDGDVFVTKCNSSGNLIWAKKLGGLAKDFATSIAVDASGNVITTGKFAGTVDFNPGAGVFNITSTPNYDTYVSKLNASGNFVWAKKIGPVSNVYSVAVDATGNIFTAGDLFPGTNSNQISINKLDPSGIVLWSKVYGGSSDDRAKSIATDVSGNIYVTGYFYGTADFDPGTGVYNLTAPGSGAEAFVTKINYAGNFLWAKQIGGTSHEEGVSIKVDAVGKVYVTGYFTSTADFDPGPGTFNLTSGGWSDIFVSKLENSGNFIWAKQFSGIGAAFESYIVVDNLGDVYTAGILNGTVDFDPGSGTFNLTSVTQDVYISKLDASGNLAWAMQFGGAQYEKVCSISLDGSGNIYSSGFFKETVDFDPGTGVTNLTSHGNPDMFIHKMGFCSPLSTLITPAGPTTFCSGGSVTLNANTGAGITYQWQRNGVSIAGATSSSYVATTAGSYSVVESNSVSCTETSNNIVVTVPCIPIGPNGERADEVNSEAIHVYPNPTTGKFVIDAPTGQLQIFNAFGQLINTSSLNNNENTVDLSGFPEGIYILRLSTEESLYIQKIVLNR